MSAFQKPAGCIRLPGGERGWAESKRVSAQDRTGLSLTTRAKRGKRKSGSGDWREIDAEIARATQPETRVYRNERH